VISDQRKVISDQCNVVFCSLWQPATHEKTTSERALPIKSALVLSSLATAITYHPSFSIMSTTLVPSKPVLQPSNSQPQSGQHTDAHQTDQRSGQENPWHPRRDASGKLFYPLTDTNKFVFDLETEQEEVCHRDEPQQATS
jgi:hypothetical protein